MDLEKIFRIVILQNSDLLVNMIYAEIGDEDYHVLGTYSGCSGGGGLFHFSPDGEGASSDDPAELNCPIDMEVVQTICTKLESMRAQFEQYDEDGNIVGLSESGIQFIKNYEADEHGYLEAYSPGASEDFIYDIQDEWNLDFYKD